MRSVSTIRLPQKWEDARRDLEGLIQDLRDVVESGLSLFGGKVVEVLVLGTEGLPLDVLVDLGGAAPAFVMIWKAVDAGTGAVVDVGVPVWEPRGSGIRITAIGGVGSGDNRIVSLVILGPAVFGQSLRPFSRVQAKKEYA